MRTKVDNLLNSTLSAYEEGSVYRGYKNPAAIPSLKYTPYEDKEVLIPIPNSTNLAWGKPGIFRPDYFGILSSLNICDYVDNKGVKEVWIWSYHYGDTEPDESNMAMGSNSQGFWNHGSYGDVSNSQQIDDMPTCKKTYTLYNFNYDRSLAEALEDRGHQTESIFNFVDSSLWSKFRNPHGESGEVVNHCGWTHSPPNTKNEYDWNNETDVLSDCEDWKPDGAGVAKTVDCHTWYGGTCLDNGGIEFKKWWMQNIPGQNNGLVYNGKNVKNWWDFLGDFDKALQLGKSLLEESPSQCGPIACG